MLADVLLAAVAARPDGALIEYADDTIGPAAFAATVKARASALRDAGAGPGSKVLIFGDRGIGFWIDMVAVWTVGGAVIPVAGDAATPYLETVVRLAAPGFVLGEAKGGFTDSTLNWLGAQERTEADRDAAVHAFQPDQTAAILFTSGSTGSPKGVVLSAQAVIGNARAISSRIPLYPADRLYCPTPQNFTSAICHFLAALLGGATLISSTGRLLKADMVDYMTRMKANCFGGAPIQLRWIAELAAERGGSSLRMAVSSGDHLSPEVIHLLRGAVPGIDIHTIYGLTEVGGRFCVLDPNRLPEAAGSVGCPIPGLSYKIVGEDGSVLPDGETGEVVIRGDYVMDRYLGADKDPFGPHGFHTGDLGRIDEDGLLRLFGRTDDVFKVSGRKVAGQTIIDAALDTGLVRQAAVVSLNDDVFGHVPALCVVLKDVETPVRQIMAAMRKTLPADSFPRKVAQADAIPMTGSGKVDRAKLRTLFQQ